MSTVDISKKLGTSPSVVQKCLSKNGIELRKVGTNVKRKRGLAYGQKILVGKQIDYKREKENIIKMIELREKGFSYWKIAEIFNSMKIPTKTSKGKWHARTVHSIILNNQTSK
jgi:hypothetical protein